MNKLKQTFFYIVLIIALIFVTSQYVYAVKQDNIYDYINKVEYSEDFTNWVKLPESQKVSTFYPKIYEQLDTPFLPENPIYQATLVGASVSSRFSLSEKIPNNLAIRNQQSTSMCWAFAGLSSLETNLALNNYKNGFDTNKVYDFSERHANYSATRNFLNNSRNIYGVTRKPSDGGQWYLIENYLTNGRGAISESEMPFVNNEDVINISELDNKTVISQVYDTVYFENYNKQTGTARTQTMNEIKQHIQNYGSVFATIHGDSANSVLDTCYDNDTGAKYCDNSVTHKIDHAVSIIGWDDNYDKNKFAEGLRPKSNGAWIVRNSWGENLEYDLNQLKTELYNSYTSQCHSRGWYKPSDIPDSFITSAGYTISGDKVLLPVGDHGLMYVSYEDCNVGTTLYGIKNSADSVDYDFIYQHNELYPALQINYGSESGVILCNVFEKKSNIREYLTEVSLMAPETYTCRVYVNPNGEEKTKDALKLVQLKAGESEEVSAGYHTLEFANPIEITGKKFAVAIEVIGTRSSIDIALEGVIDGINEFSDVRTEVDSCFMASSTDLDNCEWVDLGRLEENTNQRLTNSDSSIKAFTTTSVVDKSLNRIEIVTPPTKTEYIEGEDFEKDGMVVRAYFNDNTSKDLSNSDYSIENGTNLKVGQEYVTIKYLNKSATQRITVSEKSISIDPGDDDPKEDPIQPDEPDEDKKDDPVQPEKPDDKEEEVPKNADMKKASCTITNIQSYTYTDDSTKDYSLIDVEITGITRDMNNDSYQYFYYISSDSNLKNITNWVEIKESQKNSNKLTFKVDSRDIPNFSEVSKENKVYIYIREVVTLGGNQSVLASSAMRFDTENVKVETYVDNVKKENDGVQNTPDNNKDNGTQGTTQNNNGGQTVNPPKDDTVSQTNLPKAGATLLIVLIVIVLISGIIIFIRYEILNRYVK